PASYFFLPRWELRCERGYYCICLNLIGPRSSWQAQLSAALELLRPPVSLPAELPALGPLSHEPAQARWREEIQEAQRLFAGSELRKLVLSRKSSARLEALPLTLMQRLLEQGREAYHFWFRPFASQVLWGASPERLYARTGTTLWTEALAGTRQRSQVPSEQAALRLELLGSHKEFEENERVRQHLEAALEPLATGLKAEPLRVIPAGPVQHLYRCMQAELNPGVSDTRLVAALHPTPAVSGFPSRTAQALLAGLESHSRGWYTGAMGWISPQASEWAVLLRCALWQGQGQEIHFFTGAGIMPASRPEAEWQELDLKLSSLLSLWD
ncbi:MAG TPA: isochorismate synthase, partial [Candidatus Obscuribacterales bacterium]